MQAKSSITPISFFKIKNTTFLIQLCQGDKKKGNWYKEQLKPAPTPGVDFDFEIKEILKQKTENGKKLYFVSYEHYPAKFNRWVEADRVTLLKK